MATIAVLGTLDTKGAEHAFVAERIREHGHATMLIDAGTGGPPQVAPDITREAVGLGIQRCLFDLRQDEETPAITVWPRGAGIDDIGTLTAGRRRTDCGSQSSDSKIIRRTWTVSRRCSARDRCPATCSDFRHFMPQMS